MILYLDASALVKQYSRERGSDETQMVLAEAKTIGTGLISRVEVVAALAGAVRRNLLAQADATAAARVFRSDWQTLVRVPITEELVARADGVAWDEGLRGYDAIHLACALTWKEALDSQVTLATFDRDLWLAAQHMGLEAWPADLPALLAEWQKGAQA